MTMYSPEKALAATMTDSDLLRAKKIGAPVSAEIASRELTGRKAVRQAIDDNRPASRAWLNNTR